MQDASNAFRKSSAMSSDTSSLLVVVPAYNEEGAVSGVIRSVREVLPGVRIIVIDDGSWDDTARVAERAGADVFRLPHHLGLGGAVQTGYRFAFEHDLCRARPIYTKLMRKKIRGETPSDLDFHISFGV